MRLKSIVLVRLRNMSHFQFLRNVLAFISEAGVETLGLRALYDKLDALLKRESALLRRTDKSSLTGQIKDEDSIRDGLCRAITTITKAYLKHRLPATREAARKLKIVLDNYSNVTRISYDEQTAAVGVLLRSLKEDHQDEVEMLRLNDFVEELERVNLLIDDLINLRMDEEAAKTKDVMKKLRPEADAVYYEIRRYIDAAVIFEGEAKYKAFIDKMNVLIDRYRL